MKNYTKPTMAVILSGGNILLASENGTFVDMNDLFGTGNGGEEV